MNPSQIAVQEGVGGVNDAVTECIEYQIKRTYTINLMPEELSFTDDENTDECTRNCERHKCKW